MGLDEDHSSDARSAEGCAKFCKENGCLHFSFSKTDTRACIISDSWGKSPMPKPGRTYCEKIWDPCSHRNGGCKNHEVCEKHFKADGRREVKCTLKPPKPTMFRCEENMAGLGTAELDEFNAKTIMDCWNFCKKDTYHGHSCLHFKFDPSKTNSRRCVISDSWGKEPKQGVTYCEWVQGDYNGCEDNN